ncbi:MAG: efflux RND transporter permease subunit [Bacteroidales bacterium]|nr:efflux RND transporter permease subunit [Bacteroidales bacterium]
MKNRRGIIETVMENPTIVFLIVSILVVFGVYGLDRMNKQEFPEFPVRMGVVAAAYPGATSDEVEQQVTFPLEEYLFTYPEVDKSKTFSITKEGITYIRVYVNNSVKDEQKMWSRIRHGLRDFKAKLPAGVAAIVVVDDFGSTSSLMITLESTDKSYREMKGYMDMLKRRLHRVPAMGNIKSFGEQQEELQVTVDKERLASYGISYQLFAATLASQGLTSLGGTMETDDGVIPLHAESPLRSEAEVAEQVIFTDATGRAIQLKDVERVERRYADPTSYITKDGNRALVLSLEMTHGHNIVQFGKDVDVVLKDFQRTLPDGVRTYRITDLPKVVDDSVWSFMGDLLTAILVVILVMLMLFPLTSALIPAIEIPLTTAITIAIMYIVGYEMNTVTLAALIVTLGMIVDDSIVMIDGYMDNLRHGERPWEAALHSAKTFFPSLVVATITICSIFFPFLFTMEGVLEEFVKFFPTTISISLAVSLALAMLLTPWLEQRMIKPREVSAEGVPVLSRKDNRLTRIQNRFFHWLEENYERLLKICFARPWQTIAVGVGSVALAVLVFFNLPLQLMPMAERDSFAVEIHLPEGMGLHQTERVCQMFEGVLQEDPDVVSVTTFVGSSSPRFMAAYSPEMPGKNYAQMIVKTRNYDVTPRVIKRYKDSYVDAFSNASIRVKQLDYQGVQNPVEVRLLGEDYATLMRYADTLKAFMQKHDDDVVWVHSNCEGFLPSVKISLKPDEAARTGVTRSMLSANLAMLFGSVPVTKVWEGDYAVQVVLTSDNHGEKPNFEQLGNTLIPTRLPGVWVPLRQVADLQPDWQPSQINHRSGIPSVTVGADLRFGKSQPRVMGKMKPWIEHEFRDMLPDDVTIEYGGLDEANQIYGRGIIVGLIIAVVIVFFFLLFNFKKIRLTLLSLCGTLLCLLGAFLGLAVFGLDVSLTAVIGIVSLMGINVRNTIVMFDYAEELRATGMKLRNVAFEAGRRRMRPIFLTSITTAVGVIPMIVHRSTLWMPMGVVICFGTLCAITLIVTVLPVAYWKLFDKK